MRERERQRGGEKETESGERKGMGRESKWGREGVVKNGGEKEGRGSHLYRGQPSKQFVFRG